MSPADVRVEGAPGRAALASALGWVVPGLGHFLLGRRTRSIWYFVIVVTCFSVGYTLDGNLFVPVGGQPLTFLATLGAMGVGAPYFVARWLLAYSGSPEAAGYEYGTAFLLTAGLMNLLLVLDAWDIALGKKD